jgi:streptogramin lyase
MRLTPLLMFFLFAMPAQARDLLVSGLGSGAIHRYDAITGESKGLFASGLEGPTGLTFGPDRNLYVSFINSPEILRFNGSTGALIGSFVTGVPGPGAGARTLLFGPDGDLFIGYGGESPASNRVVRVSGQTGAYLSTVAEGNGMIGITSIAFGPDGDLYVAAALSNEVFVFRGTSGEYIRKFTCGDRNRNLTGLLFLADGTLLATASDRGAILRYDPATGACLGEFTSSGLNVPISVIAGVDGNLLVASLLANSVVKINPATGSVAGTLVRRLAGGLSQPHSLVLFPPDEQPAARPKRRRAVRH